MQAAEDTVQMKQKSKPTTVQRKCVLPLTILIQLLKTLTKLSYYIQKAVLNNAVTNLTIFV